MAEVAQRTSDHVIHAFNRTGEQAHDLALQSSQSLAVMTEAGNILSGGFADISQEWFSLMQAQLRRNIDGFTALARCRSIADVIECQNGLRSVIGCSRRAGRWSRQDDRGVDARC